MSLFGTTYTKFASKAYIYLLSKSVLLLPYVTTLPAHPSFIENCVGRDAICTLQPLEHKIHIVPAQKSKPPQASQRPQIAK